MSISAFQIYCLQVQPYKDLAASLEDFQTLKELHYDEGKKQFLDYGDHSEDISLQVKVLSGTCDCSSVSVMPQ